VIIALYCTGQSTQFLLSLLVKHLDHKAVRKQPEMQLDIVKVTSNIAEQSKAPTSTAIIGAMTDLVKHLRKNMHSTLGNEDLGDGLTNKLRTAVDECLFQLSKKVLLHAF